VSAIKFEIDGQLVDPNDASWYCYAPCGCCCGVTVLVRNSELLATEDQVWREWEPNATNRKRDRAAGFELRLGLRARVRELLVMDCPHEPKWGVAKTPIPDGHRWAVTSQSPTSRDRRHIVLTANTVDTPKRGEPFPEWTGIKHESLCGRSEMRWWGDRLSVSDLPECTRCVKSAKRLAESSMVEPAEVTA